MNSEPKLAPPGAGLPAVELFVARMLFRWKRLTGNRESFNAAFQAERDQIRVLVQSCDDTSAAQRVLIPRPRGLEDSSRNWSVWMTLDHLRIVHGSIIRVIGALTKGAIPPGTASIAAVKPSPAVTADVVRKYEQSCDDLLKVVATQESLKTSARYAHPWFGLLDAAGWHAMAATHLGIHRVQLEQIIAGHTTKSR